MVFTGISSLIRASAPIAAIGMVLSLVSGCEPYPRDPQGSLEAAKTDGLKVGIIHAAASTLEAPPQREVDLVNGFAEHLGAEVQWTRGSESHLMPVLQEGELHLVLGGVTRKNPWRKQLGMSKPYYTEQVVVCSTDDTPVPKDLEGVTVAGQRGSWHIADIKRHGARPLSVDVLREHEGLVAVDMHGLHDAGCGPAGHVLAKHKHVVAVPKGENALLVNFEEYLHEQGY